MVAFSKAVFQKPLDCTCHSWPVDSFNLWLKSWVYVILHVRWWALARPLLCGTFQFFLPSLCGSTGWVRCRGRKAPVQPRAHCHPALAQSPVTSECSNVSSELGAGCQAYGTLMTFSPGDLREPEARGTSKDRNIRKSRKRQNSSPGGEKLEEGFICWLKKNFFKNF